MQARTALESITTGQVNHAQLLDPFKALHHSTFATVLSIVVQYLHSMVFTGNELGKYNTVQTYCTCNSLHTVGFNFLMQALYSRQEMRKSFLTV